MANPWTWSAMRSWLPPQEVLDRCEAYLVRPVDTRTLYNDLWTDLGILS